MNTAHLILALAGLYVSLGVFVALGVLLGGLGKIDHAVSESTWGFKMLVVPGLAALWPLMLMRWIRGTGHPPSERNAHRKTAKPSTGGVGS